MRALLPLLLLLLLACRAAEPAPPATERRDAGIPAVAIVTALLADEGGWWLGTYDRVGMWHSADAGASWETVPALPAPIHDLARAGGARWAATGDGLWRERDGAWEKVAGLPEGEAMALAVDGEALYVTFGLGGLWRVAGERAEAIPLAAGMVEPDGGALSVAARGAWLLVGTSGDGAWESRDGGATWRRLPLGEESFASVVGFSESGEPWARTRESLWRSPGGEAWEAAPLPGGVEAMALLPGSGGPWAGSADGRLFRWVEGAWQGIGPALPTPMPIIEISAGDGTLLVGRQDGVWTLDGAAWRRAGTPGEARIEALARLADGTLLAGHLDGLYRSTDGGATWSWVRVGDGAAVASLASDPHAPGRVWLGTPGSGLFRSEDGGATWAAVEGEGAPVRSFNALFPDPQQPGRLLAQVPYDRFYEWRAERWAPTWEGIPVDVESFTLAFDPARAGHLWAGTAAGIVERSPDGRWERRAPALAEQSVTALLAEEGALWAGATRGLFRVEGDEVTAMALSGLTVGALARHEGRLYAGSRFYGLYVEGDGGAWSRVEPLGERSVTALLSAPEGLWAATSDGLWLVRGGGEAPYRPPAPVEVAAAEPLPPAEAPALFIHLLNPSDALFREAAARGAAGVLILLPWREIEPNPDEWHWERADSWLHAARHYGLEVVIRLDQSPTWASDEPPDGALNPLPRDWADYADYAAHVARRYRGQARGYVLWNEPNLALDWGNRPPDPAGYLDLLRATVPALRAADPGALIAAGALAPTTRDDATAMDDLRYLDELLAAGAGEWFDVLAVHPYPFGQPPDAPAEANGGLVMARLDGVRALMQRYGLGERALWATEFGYSVGDGALGASVDGETRARWLGEAMVRFAAEYPEVAMVALWNLSAGLPASDEKAGYNVAGDEAAWAALAPWARGARPGQPVPPVALAADVRVHLGDSQLPPPWWPLYGGALPSTRWAGGFYLDALPDEPRWLIFELFQANERGNELRLNGARLHTEGLPVGDFTAQWVTVRLRVEPSQLRVGWNEVAFRAGQLTPPFQAPRYLWDDVMLRNVRVEE